MTIPEEEYGYTYTYTVDGQPWTADMPILKDTVVECTKTHITYTVTYKVNGEVKDTYYIEYQKNVTIPEEEYGYTYTYAVDGQLWTADMPILKDTIIECTKTPITYTVTYKVNGEVVDTYYIEYQQNVSLPDEEYGYTYTYAVDGQPWTANMSIVKNTTIECTKTPVKYKVKYLLKGELVHTEDVDYLSTATGLEEQEGYIYRYIADDNEWDFVVTKDIDIQVQKIGDSIDFKLNLYEFSVQGDTAKGYYYGQAFTPVWQVQEGARVEIYKDSVCLQPAMGNIILEKGENIVYIKVIAESGKSKIYKTIIDRAIPDELGVLRVPYVAGSDFVVSIGNKLLGNPEITVKAGTTTYRNIVLDCDYNANEKNLLVYGQGVLSPNSEYWIEIIVTYDEITLISEPIKINTNYIASNECDVISCLSHPGTVDQTNKQITNVIVNNSEERVEIELKVSNNATWSLYEDAGCKKEVKDKIFDLTDYAGKSKTMYIKVLAENKIAYKIYSITIYRQSKTTNKPYVTLNDGLITITTKNEGKILYTTDGSIPSDFNPFTMEYKEPFSTEGIANICVIAKDKDKDEYCDPVAVTNTAYDVVYIGENGNILKTEKVLENGFSMPLTAPDGYKYILKVNGELWDVNTPITEDLSIVAELSELKPFVRLELIEADEKASGEYYFSYNVTSDDFVSGVVVYSLYDDNGVLTAVEVKEINTDSERYFNEHTVMAKAGATSYKIMLLTDLKDMIPIAEMISNKF